MDAPLQAQMVNLMVCDTPWWLMVKVSWGLWVDLIKCMVGVYVHMFVISPEIK